MTPPEVTDGVVHLRVREVSDAEAWKAGEDIEQIRWFEAHGPAPMANNVKEINNWRSDWTRAGPRRHFGIWTNDGLCGGVELRVRRDGRANVSYLVFHAAHRTGMARRALDLATHWAIVDLAVPAVVAIVDERNVALIGVATSSGFTLEGVADPWKHSESGVRGRP